VSIKKAVAILFFSLVLLLAGAVLYSSIREYLVVAPDFVYDLRSRAAEPVSYLPERESRRLAPDPSTVAYFSNRRPFQTGEILQTMGIPAYRCRQITDANGTRILLLDIDPDHPVHFDPAALRFLSTYLKAGGVVVGSGLFASEQAELLKLFGLKAYRPNREHTELILGNSPYYRPYLNRPEERRYRLAAKPGGLWTNTLVPAEAVPIAFYEDRSPAVTKHRAGKGEAIALGMSLYDLRFRNLVGRDFQANRLYINHFEPLSDLVPFFLKGIYRKRTGRGFTLSTAPGSFRATVIVTHDVDFVESVTNMKRFYHLERSEGAPATYNIWVKYLKDDKDVPFFTPQHLKTILEAQDMGFEIGSHTVEHTANFNKLPLGTCRESYPAYRPYSVSYHRDKGNPTLCGEVKVSKELLLGAGVKKVVSFRSGELLYHPQLPEVLERFGYRYSSCFSAEDVLSYFPYRYMKDYYQLRNPSRIWEIPLVYEDEKFPPLIFRLDQARELLDKVAENGGVFTLLIHPDLTWWKLKNLDLYFLKKFLEGLPKGIGLASMESFGRFWDLRDRVVWRYRVTEKGVDITLWSPAAFTVALEPFGWHWQEESGEGYRIRNGRIVLRLKPGMNRWTFALPSS